MCIWPFVQSQTWITKGFSSLKRLRGIIEIACSFVQFASSSCCCLKSWRLSCFLSVLFKKDSFWSGLRKLKCIFKSFGAFLLLYRVVAVEVTKQHSGNKGMMGLRAPAFEIKFTQDTLTFESFYLILLISCVGPGLLTFFVHVSTRCFLSKTTAVRKLKLSTNVNVRTQSLRRIKAQFASNEEEGGGQENTLTQ